jgi:hypothetical protein
MSYEAKFHCKERNLLLLGNSGTLLNFSLRVNLTTEQGSWCICVPPPISHWLREGRGWERGVHFLSFHPSQAEQLEFREYPYAKRLICWQLAVGQKICKDKTEEIGTDCGLRPLYTTAAWYCILENGRRISRWKIQDLILKSRMEERRVYMKGLKNCCFWKQNNKNATLNTMKMLYIFWTGDTA